MNDALFDRFVSRDNLRLAFEFVKSEIAKSTLPLDPFWIPGVKAIDKLGNAFFASLSKQLAEGQYLPGPNYLFHQHKPSFGIRRLAMLTMVDRVVYQALLNRDVLGNQLVSKGSELSYYPGISKTGDHLYLESYSDYYKSFWKAQRTYFDDSEMNFRGEYDVHAFYDNIPHKTLFDMIENDQIGTSKVRSLLLKILSSWYPSGRGVPQGPDPSSVLANYYLRTVDNAFDGFVSDVGYVRYMDDMVIMAKSNNDLMKAVEKLTELLDSLGLDLNSKSKSEVLDSSAYFDDKGIEHPYLDYESFNDWVHTEDMKVKAEAVINKLFMGEEVEKMDISTLRYHLKSTNDYTFAKNIIGFYPELPSIADMIARYLQPYGSESWVQSAIENMFVNAHLFRWQRFWLAKLVLVEQGKDEQSYSRFNFCKSRLWEIRSMAWLTKSMRDPEAIGPSELINLMKNSENIFELGLYVEASAYLLPDETVDNYLRNLGNGKTLEMQMLVSARMLHPTQIDVLSKTGELFSKSKLPLGNTTEVMGQKNISIEKVLGVASKVSDRKSRYVFEIQSVGEEIVMMGSLLSGVAVPAFNSDRSSRYYYVVKELLARHIEYKPDVYRNYAKSEIEDLVEVKDDEVDYVKSRRNLVPLCETLIKYMLDVKIDKSSKMLRFRSAITPEEFKILPDKVLAKIDDMVSDYINAVN